MRSSVVLKHFCAFSLLPYDSPRKIMSDCGAERSIELTDLLRPGAAPLFPLPLPRRPVQPASRGSRSRQRFTQKMNLWRATVKYIHALNSLHVNMSQLTPSRRSPRHPTSAQVEAVSRAFRLCRLVQCARRVLRMIGAEAALSILKTAPFR